MCNKDKSASLTVVIVKSDTPISQRCRENEPHFFDEGWVKKKATRLISTNIG